MEEYTPLSYLANVFYLSTCKREGCEPVRWGALSDDLKQIFLEKCKKLVDEWKADEQASDRAV
ncbi:MAG: hypothetical protein ACFB0B_15310 [Thermonemataceae bacterium]